MEEDDFAFNVDEDYFSPSLTPDQVGYLESQGYSRLCYDCLKEELKLFLLDFEPQL